MHVYRLYEAESGYREFMCGSWRAPMIARMAAAEAMAAEQRRKYQARLKAVRT